MAQPLRTNSPMTSIDTRVIEVELNELRHHLEQEVKKRTEQLTRCITLLESCNATLCDKLALAHKKFAALRRQPARILLIFKNTKPNDRAVRLYIMNN